MGKGGVYDSPSIPGWHARGCFRAALVVVVVKMIVMLVVPGGGVGVHVACSDGSTGSVGGVAAHPGLRVRVS